MNETYRPIPRLSDDDWEKFFARVTVDTVSSCWLWVGTCKADGYGLFNFASSTYLAHRVSWSLTGQDAPALQLHHECGRPSCCNPLHLTPTGARSNTLWNDSVTAINHRKRACRRGHPFTAENTRIVTTKGGYPGRCCKTCEKIHAATTRARKRAARAAAPAVEAVLQ